MRTLWIIVLVFSQLCVFAQDNPAFTVQQPSIPQVPVASVDSGRRLAPNPVIRLNIYTTYAFDDKVDVRESHTSFFRGKIQGGFQWGGGLEYMLIPTQSIELIYLRLKSDSPMNYYDNDLGQTVSTVYDLSSNFIMLSSNRYFKTNLPIEPFVGAQAGITIFNNSVEGTSQSESATKFAWGARAGVNIWVSDRVGLKIQAGLLSAVQSVGGGLFLGTGGIGAGINAYSSYMQFNIGGGLIFNLGK